MNSQNYDTLRVEVHDNIATVYLSNGKGNAMSRTFFKEIDHCFRTLGSNTSVRVIILRADGKYFTVGLDLKDAAAGQEINGGEMDVARKSIRQRNHILELQDSFTTIENCPQPVIFATHGAVVGGGVDLSCCCDIRVASESAWFCIKEVDVGLAADLGTLQRIPKIVGNSSIVREWAYTARKFSAKEALKYGLISRVYDTHDELFQGVYDMAKEIASKSPVAIVGTKVNLNYARDHSVKESLEYQATWSSSMLQSEDLPKRYEDLL
jgi:Delta3,5-Delta2,4-dienoyl-CoA isomerase